MRLRKIRLAGFKSFVDPTTIEFPGSVVGVVGPNGLWQVERPSTRSDG